MFSACHPEQREASALCSRESRSFAALRMTVIKGDCESYNPAHDDAAISFFLHRENQIASPVSSTGLKAARNDMVEYDQFVLLMAKRPLDSRSMFASKRVQA